MVTIKKGNAVICKEVELANHFFTRFMGLMYRKSMKENHGLLLVPCNEIHTFGMKFDIDTVTLSKNNEILSIDNSVPPKKIRSKVKGGHKVLELCSGVAGKQGLQVGDKLDIIKQSSNA